MLLASAGASKTGASWAVATQVVAKTRAHRPNRRERGGWVVMNAGVDCYRNARACLERCRWARVKIRKPHGRISRSTFAGAFGAVNHPLGRENAGILTHEEHPQLLHHRPHRPREKHPGRSAPPNHGNHFRPRIAGANAGRHGFGAGARHHHQKPRHPNAVPRQGRRGLRVEPDRHPRPRRLQLRSVPVHCSM